MRMPGAVWLVMAVVIVGSYGVSAAGTYQWEDSNGDIHFTDNPENIPSVYRKKARELDLKSYVSPTAPVGGIAPVAQTPVSADARKDEQLWRRRYEELRAEITLLKDRLPAKREELTAIGRKRIKFQKGSDRVSFNELSAEITRDEERVKELEKKLDELDLEAARSAVPLEWRK